MEPKKNLPWISCLACSGTFVGIIINAAFISGNLAFSYFAKFGWVGIFMPILSMALITFGFWEAMNAAANNKLLSARHWADWISRPFDKIYGTAFDVVTLVGCCLSIASGIAAMGTLLSEWFGFNYTAVCAIYAAVVIMIALTNAGIISKFGGVICVLLIICMLFVYPQVISHNSATLGNYITNHVMFEDYTLGDAIWRAIVWFGFCCVNFGGMMALRRDGGYSTRRDAKRIIFVGAAVVTVLLIMTVLVVLGSLPECQSSVPVLTAIGLINNPALLTMYRICMFLALLSTNGPGLYALGGRWAMALPRPQSHKLRMFICCLAIILASLAISSFGLTAIISKGWTYVGTIGVFLYGIPIFTIGIVRTRRENKIPEVLVDETKEKGKIS